MPIKFNNPITAATYEALTDYDQWVEVPPKRTGCNCQTFQGLISNITPCAAERYLEYKGNLLRKKETPDALPEEGSAVEVKEEVQYQLQAASQIKEEKTKK